MRLKITILILVLFLAAGCTQPKIDQAALETSIFGEPLPQQVDIHDHDAHDHTSANDHAQDALPDQIDHDYTPAGEYPRTAGKVAAPGLQIVLVPSELVVGHNRMAVGLLDEEQQMIHDATVNFQYFDLSDPDAPRPEQQAEAYPVQSPDGLTTIFAQERRFERAGAWGLEVEAQLAGGETAVQRIRFDVAAATDAVLPGETAPSLQTPTLADVNGDFSRITSAWEPNPAFYRLSLDEALRNGKPTLLLLATPAFCRTRFCGPAYAIATKLEAAHGDRVNFIHVEVYSGLPQPAANDWELSPVMDAFGLSTEPWVYVIDKNGEVLYRAEGVFTQAEIAGYLQ